MTHDEFVNNSIGKPWRNRADGPDYYDCWGLVVDYFRQVRNIDLSVYLDGDIVDGYLKEIESDKWRECEGGIVFMCFKNGHPAHCGLIFDSKVLHASGWQKDRGQVTYHSTRKMNKLFKDMRVYEYC